MQNHGTDFLNAPPPPKRRRNARQNQIIREEGEHVSPEEIDAALTYLQEADAGSRRLTQEVARLAADAHALLAGGLTENAVVLLIQDLGPKPHGRPVPRDTILAILKAAARLREHLRPEAKR